MKRVSNLMLTAAAMMVLGLSLSGCGESEAVATSVSANEPIVGLWQVTWTDTATQQVILKLWDVWHADQTETQDDTTPVLIGNVCQGAWIPLGNRTYGLTHPAFNFLSEPEDQEGQPDPNSSALILERLTVSKDGNSFQGPGIYKTIAGMDPLDPHAAVLSSENITITGKRVQVDKSQIP